jgi:hypothetical protein
VHPDREPDVETLDEVVHRDDEPLPRHVGLGALEQQERRALGVGHRVQLERRLVVGLPVVGVEDHQRPARAIVEELVDVEGRDQLVVEGLQQVITQQLSGRAGVDESGQGMHEHGPVQLGQARLEHVELVRVEHDDAPPRSLRPTA